MKVLVYQVRIGTNNIQSDRYGTNTGKFWQFEKEACIPSVENWAKRCGYDYKIYTESTILKFNDSFFERPSDFYSAEKMMHLFDENYDYVIYIDSDVYVKPSTKSFPLQKGFSAVVEPVSLDDYLKTFSFTEEPKYFNAGVFSVDYETGKDLHNFFIGKLASGDNNKIVQAEQDIINEWILNNECNELDEKWNYLLHRYGRESIDILSDFDNGNLNLSDKNIFHFISEAKVFYRELCKIITKPE